jgi:hypothetical protein
MRNMISKLPNKFRWSIHNIFAHPISEILFLIGLDKLSKTIHDQTIPNEEVKQ